MRSYAIIKSIGGLNMEMMLAENIRMYRKRKRLTQEQLAEDLGVTSGAVYKWEAKLSVPELNMIIEIADYFDTSVDALLGYTMKDNRLSVTVQRLKEYRIKKEYIGLADAEKALKKFPHAFEVVHESAVLYRVFGYGKARGKVALAGLGASGKVLYAASAEHRPGYQRVDSSW